MSLWQEVLAQNLGYEGSAIVLAERYEELIRELQYPDSRIKVEIPFNEESIENLGTQLAVFHYLFPILRSRGRGMLISVTLGFERRQQAMEQLLSTCSYLEIPAELIVARRSFVAIDEERGITIAGAMFLERTEIDNDDNDYSDESDQNWYDEEE